MLSRLRTAVRLTALDLLRRRVVLLLLFLVPSLFFAAILLTTSLSPIPFQLAALGPGRFALVPQRQEALVFVGLAAAGALTAFLALNLLQREAEAAWRLVLCGYRPAELVAARLAVLVGVIVAVSVYLTSALPVLFLHPLSLSGTLVGFLLCGWVYGCYGLLVGALFRQELEGVLFVVLMVNIDIAWLQNPIYYAHAQNQVVIRSLPGYWPSQVAMGAAFAEELPVRAVLGALFYGAALLGAALAVYAWRLRAGSRSAAPS